MIINETTPRMTKRVKNYKPKQNLSRAQVQTLVAYFKSKLDDLEWSINSNTAIAMDIKNNTFTSSKEHAELYFKKADKQRKERNKLSAIQHKLKRGLV